METLVLLLLTITSDFVVFRDDIIAKWGCDKMIVFPCTFGHVSGAHLWFINAAVNLELLSAYFA